MPLIAVTRLELESQGLSHWLPQDHRYDYAAEILILDSEDPRATECLLRGIGQVMD